LAALTIAATRLVATRWTDHLNLIQTLIFLGVLAGTGLGQSIFSPRQVALFALAYGLFAVPWQLGLTLGHGTLWTERLISLANRLTIALSQLARDEPVPDPLLFLCQMAILFWALSVHAGYNLTRYARPWRATLPAGLTLLVIQTSDSFVSSRVWFLAVYLLFSILLLARLTHLHNRARWQQNRTFLPPYSRLDLAHITLVAVTLLILVAWIVPSLAVALPYAKQAWQHATQPWGTVLDRLGRAFASLRGTAGPVISYVYYGEQLSLGRGGELTDTPIMTVEGPPRPVVSIHDLSVQYYWRARVYDYYADSQWTNTLTTTQSVTPTHFDLTFPRAEERSMAMFTFVPAVPLGTLYTASQPLWVSRPAQADLAYNPDGTVDLSALHASPFLHAGETYRVRSSLSSATIAQLRAAGTDYPLWVTSRYLQLSPAITPRTKELARQIALGLDNPYDVAAALTDYLRTYNYRETIPSPPPNQQPLDWFLFDLREGFCNYYASAEVILLRSLGIPARLAVGFAQGEYQDESESETYLVRQHDAHAWPEVYFPGLGWIEFEPTASQPPIHRPLGESQADAAAGPTTPGGAEGGQGDRPEELVDLEGDPLSGSAAADSGTTVAFWVSCLALSLILTTLVWRRRRQRGQPSLPVLLEAGLSRFDLRPPAFLHRWALYTVLLPVERAYLELSQALARLGAPPRSADTPAERAATLMRLLPSAAGPAQSLLAEYHTTIYSPHLGNLRIAQQAARAIRNLSWRARIRRLFVRRESLPQTDKPGGTQIGADSRG